MARRRELHDLQAWQEQLGLHAQSAITQYTQSKNTAFNLHRCSHGGKELEV